MNNSEKSDFTIFVDEEEEESTTRGEPPGLMAPAPPVSPNMSLREVEREAVL